MENLFCIYCEILNTLQFSLESIMSLVFLVADGALGLVLAVHSNAQEVELGFKLELDLSMYGCL